MSEPRLFVQGACAHDEPNHCSWGSTIRPPYAAELLAAVRAGVESGTIKGEGRRMCDAHDDVEAYKNPDACRAGLNANDEAACVMVAYLVIPVSDGGSET